MAENSKIAWTTHTFNCWRGCTKVSAGCANCYAETMSGRNPKVLGVWGPGGTRVVAAESKWREPVKWNRLAAWCGNPACKASAMGRTDGRCSCGLRVERPRVFCTSLADVFEDWRGSMVDAKGEELGDYGNTGPLSMGHVRFRLFDLIADTPNLDWLLLTKRPENVLRMTYDAWCERVPGHVSQNEGDGRRWAFPPNVWLGTSVEDQKAADARIPHLLRVPAAVRFLSMEPLLGPVSLSPYRDQAGGVVVTQGIDCDWVIVGGESGPDARTCRVEWVRSVVDQCKAAGVPCFVKQLGASVTTTLPDGEAWPGHTGPTSPVQFSGDGFGNYHVSGLRDKKGGDPAEWPSDLRVREFPRPVANTEGR